jgi:prophage regulatory protein
MDQHTTFYSDKDLAKRYRIHRTTLWGWVRKGNYPQPDRLSDGCSRWTNRKVDAWEKAHLDQEA